MTLAPMLADTDWTIIISAVGSTLVIVIGALGREVYKVVTARWAFEREQRATDDKAKAEAAAGERRNRRDTIAEYQKLLDAKEKDGQEWRQQVHDLRNDMGTVNSRLAVCEWDRKRLQFMIEDQEDALRRAGISVHYRRVPDPPPEPEAVAGPVTPHGPAGAAGREETTVE